MKSAMISGICSFDDVINLFKRCRSNCRTIVDSPGLLLMCIITAKIFQASFMLIDLCLAFQNEKAADPEMLA